MSRKVLSIAVLICLLVTLCATAAGCRKADSGFVGSVEQMNGKAIATLTGSVYDLLIQEKFPDSPVEYANSAPDLAAMVDAGKVQGYVADEPVARLLTKEYSNQSILTILEDIKYAFIFQQENEHAAALCEQMNRFLKKLSDDGTLQEIDDIWFGDDESKKTVDMSGLSAENGVLDFAVSSSVGAPFLYIKDNVYVGYDMDIAVRFCREYGYGLHVVDASWNGFLTNISTGKCDFGASCVSVTEERKEAILFSDPSYQGGVALVARAATPHADGAIKTLNDLDGKKIAVLTGTEFDRLGQRYIPGCQIEYVNAEADAAAMLETGKVSAYIADGPVARSLLRAYPDHTVLADLQNSSYGFVYQKDDPDSTRLCGQMNEYLAACLAGGTLDELADHWFGQSGKLEPVDMSGLSAENGILTYGIDAVTPPFAYALDGGYAGYEVDLVVRFCREYGYGLNIRVSDFVGLLSGVSSGKFDLISSCVAITPERRETVLFSAPYYEGSCVVITKSRLTPEYASVGELTGKSVAVLTGTYLDQVAKAKIPGCQLQYANTSADMAVMLDSGKVEGYVVDEPIARKLLAPYSDHVMLTSLGSNVNGFIFQKDSERGTMLWRQMNEYLAAIRADGTLEEISAVWFGEDEEKKPVDMSGLTGENGTVRVGTFSGTGEPFSYIKDGQCTGYDLDIVARFCREYGYGLEIADTEFLGLLSGVSQGKYDIGASGITVTEERKQSFLFSDPNYVGNIALVVRSRQVKAPVGRSFLTSIKESFEKTFVREERWRLFFSGISVTMLITVLSAVLGTLLGFLIYLLCRNGGRAVNGIINVVMDVLSKTPTVVILMVLYYIVFGNMDMSGMWVSVVGFTLLFAGNVVSQFRVGVSAVDRGQREAALALGYTEWHTFTGIILPQAAKYILPGYKGAVVSLIKDTAIVGYIAVQDLTKVSDIVRSRTYEAFFPLIATAVIYFGVAWLLTVLVRRVEIRTDPRRRKPEKILKGVERK